jgi:FkbM family methyltransferase
MATSLRPLWRAPEATSVHPVFNNPKFLSTKLGRELAGAPLGFIDVGARGGVHELIDPLGELARIIAFEPDPDAHTRELVRQAADRGRHVPEIVVHAVGLGDHEGKQELHLTRLPAASSLMKPNALIIDRYHMGPPQPVGRTVTVDIKRLDDVLSQGQDKHAGEIVKIDTQGAELSVLKGAVKTLATNTVSLFVEVEFLQIYEGQPLFSDVEAYLRDQGFSFYGFDKLHFRSTRRNNPSVAPRSRERVYWADAIFFKDPFSSAAQSLTLRQSYALLISAILFRYTDFALEIIDRLDTPDQDKAILMETAKSFSFVDQKETLDSVRLLEQQMRAQPESANQILGKWLESQQPFSDFQHTET